QVHIVKSVVEEVLKKLETKKETMPQQLVGHEDRIKYLTDLLDVNHLDVRFIGIYGMGGVGKTTIAKVVFNRLHSHFGKYCSFLKDVRETSSTKEGIIRLQKKLLSDIGRPESAKQIEDIEEGMRRIRATLSNKKVLIVLDDVDKKVLIKNLMGNAKLYLGSRVIITTRNIDILQVEGSEVKIEQYEMEMMDDSLALRLFCRHAFHRDYPLDDYRELSRKIVSLMGGLPLAIEVVGSLLKYKEDKTIWEEKIIKLTEVLDKGILDVLKISYDELDEFQKKIFLDIACFFFNEKKTDAIYMWESCKFYPRGGIEVLTKRCLIKTLDGDKFWMHDQLIALGKQIVYEENQDDPAKRSRLWNAEEALQIIGTEERKDKVQALEIDGLDDNIEIKSEDFKSLPNLRFLRLGHGTFVGDFSKCRSNLRWISWRHPENFRANNIYLDHLIVFKLDISILNDDSKAWDLIKRARNLKVLSLTRCHGITRIPDFSKCLALEKLTLKRCSKLKRIESFIGDLRPLIELEVERCMELKYLPENLGDLVDLERFSLSGCSKLRELPGSLGKLTSLIDLDLSCCRGLTYLPEEVGALSKLKHFLLQGCCGLIELPGSLGNLTSLAKLDLSHTKIAKLPSSIKGLAKLKSFLLKDTRIRELPNSIGKLKSLCVLRLSKIGFSSLEHHVWQLPGGISMLKDLEELDLSWHNELRIDIPDQIGELSSLRILNLEGTCICKIPRTINKLHHIQKLNLRGCHVIRWLPELPRSLTCLLLQSKSLLLVPNLWNLTSLVELLLSDASRNTGQSKVITRCNLMWIGRLPRLKKLDLNLLNFNAPSELASLSHLEELALSHLALATPLQLPSSLLRLILRFFSIKGAKLLPSCLKLSNLSTLEFCSGEVKDIPLNGLPKLENLIVHDCKLLQRLSIPLKLTKLQRVCVACCPQLVEIQVLGPLESLESFSIFQCVSLRRIGELSYLTNLKTLEIERCNVLTNVEGLHKLRSLEYLKVIRCTSLGRFIGASGTNIPDDCSINIEGISTNRYGEEILPDTSNKPPLRDVEFTVGVHCKGCVSKKFKCVREMEGLLSMQFDRDMGTFKVIKAKYAEAPAEISREKMTRADEIIPPKKEKEGSEAKEKEGGGKDKKGGGCIQAAESRDGWGEVEGQRMEEYQRECGYGGCVHWEAIYLDAPEL
ncbi:hypothetical protein ACJRO7_015793, partial [Eucalyptus globulus]